jgi:hypothetical protein
VDSQRGPMIAAGRSAGDPALAVALAVALRAETDRTRAAKCYQRLAELRVHADPELGRGSKFAAGADVAGAGAE